jgi:glycosyltransferase involved in cell wall biosynthesis
VASVLILQHRLLHYREKLFDQLRLELRDRGIDLQVLYGQSSDHDATRKDVASLAWGLEAVNVYLKIFGNNLLWQKIPKSVNDFDLIIAMQENKIISNYPLQFRSMWANYLFAFWGHGRNMQSVQPNGWRERWKKFFISKVDWWFAYTADTVRYLDSVGVPVDRITNLNNAIDGAQFRADLAAISEVDVAAERVKLGIPEGVPVALFCSSLYKEKRISFLIESARAVRRLTPNFHLIVVGDGPDGPLLRDVADGLPWLHWVGMKTGRQKAVFFRLASLQMFPGALGLHVLDSFVAAQPIVTLASSLHGPEVGYLENNVNCRIVESNSAADYAAQVVTLFEDANLMRRLSERCRDDASRFTLEHMVQRFADGIVECLVRNNRMTRPV